jgi:hypothetical protein
VSYSASLTSKGLNALAVDVLEGERLNTALKLIKPPVGSNLCSELVIESILKHKRLFYLIL